MVSQVAELVDAVFGNLQTIFNYRFESCPDYKIK